MLTSAVLEMKLFHTSHTESRLENHSRSVMKKFNFHNDQLTAWTHDEVANMVLASKILSEKRDWNSQVYSSRADQVAWRTAFKQR